MGNLFQEYVEHGDSNTIADGMAYIEYVERKRDELTPEFSRDIRDVREELSRMKVALDMVVNNYGPLLPTGWTLVNKFDKWVERKACVGFKRIDGEENHCIGGDAVTINDLAYQLDRLYVHLFGGA